MPVINPWVFYLMSVVDSLSIAADIGTVVTGFTTIVFFILYSIDVVDYGADDDNTKRTQKILKPLAVVTIVFAAASIFVPSSKTITKMIVAQNVTYERVEVATDVVKDVYEDIMALFEDGGEDG